MKKSVLFIFIFFSVLFSYGQNKTLGVGSATPNPNAALHVESPTNNQGFIMPRLTTANRTAPGFQGVLTLSDIGLMVYDTDLKAIYIWDGTAWGSAAKLAFPYQDSILTAPANSNLLKLYYGGTAPGNVGVAYFENLNPNNAFGPLFVRTFGTGSASNFFVSNSASAGAAVGGTTIGTGPAIRGLNSGTGNGFAGLFQNSNATNTFPAIQANTVGTGPGLRVLQNPTSLGSGVDVILQNTSGNAFALSVNNQGLNNAGNFAINNALSTARAVNASTSGTGAALFGSTSSGYAAVAGQHNGATNGFGGLFEVTNAANTYQAIKATTAGTGGAARFENTNAAGTNSNVESVTNSPGGAIKGTSTGTGYGAWFEINNASSSASALLASTNGTGSSASFNVTNAGSTAPALSINHSGTGNAITANRPIQATQFIGDGSGLTNLPSVSFPISTSMPDAAPLFDVTNTGPGMAGKFVVNNISNVSPALYTETNGSSYAFMARQISATSGHAGYFEVSNVVNPASGVYAKTYGTGNAIGGLTTGTGTAGRFEINNSGNTSAALEAVTDGTGAAISANNNGSGYGIYARAIGNTDAIYAEKQATDGPGSAGNFWNGNASNGASVLFAATNAGAGTALGLMNTVDGNALTIFQGGIQVSSVSISSAGAITAKAGLYEISVAGPFTLPASGSVGETCLVSNTSGSSITVSGSSVLTATVRQFIRLTGGWQIVN